MHGDSVIHNAFIIKRFTLQISELLKRPQDTMNAQIFLQAHSQQGHCKTTTVPLCEPAWVSICIAQNLQFQLLPTKNKFSSLTTA